MEGYEANAERDGAGGKGGDWDSDHAEHVLHAEFGKGLCGEDVAVYVLDIPHWSFLVC